MVGLWVGESGWQGGEGDLWHLEKQLLRSCMEKTGGHLVFLSRFLSLLSLYTNTHKHTGNSWMLLNQSLEQEITLPGKLHFKSGQTVIEIDYYCRVITHTRSVFKPCPDLVPAK